jgi:hypothetical protein
MTFNRLSVLLILYVAADFANPLMPGAVNYLNGSVEAIQADRLRTTDALRVAPIVASFERIEVEDLQHYPAYVGPNHSVTRFRLTPVRRAPLTRLDSPPSSEDH